jgi:hypothetical protein
MLKKINAKARRSKAAKERLNCRPVGRASPRAGHGLKYGLSRLVKSFRPPIFIFLRNFFALPTSDMADKEKRAAQILRNHGGACSVCTSGGDDLFEIPLFCTGTLPALVAANPVSAWMRDSGKPNNKQRKIL